MSQTESMITPDSEQPFAVSRLTLRQLGKVLRDPRDKKGDLRNETNLVDVDPLSVFSFGTISAEKGLTGYTVMRILRDRLLFWEDIPDHSYACLDRQALILPLRSLTSMSDNGTLYLSFLRVGWTINIPLLSYSDNNNIPQVQSYEHYSQEQIQSIEHLQMRRENPWQDIKVLWASW
jgi:hypothetical protein